MSRRPLSPGERREARSLAARLAHDVGKYVARTARNLSPGAPPHAALVAMLERDLYQLKGGRASSLFEQMARPLERLAADLRIARARDLFAELDRLEPSIAAGDRASIERASAIACSVERTLRELARDLADPVDTP